MQNVFIVHFCPSKSDQKKMVLIYGIPCLSLTTTSVAREVSRGQLITQKTDESSNIFKREFELDQPTH